MEQFINMTETEFKAVDLSTLSWKEAVYYMGVGIRKDYIGHGDNFDIIYAPGTKKNMIGSNGRSGFFFNYMVHFDITGETTPDNIKSAFTRVYKQKNFGESPSTDRICDLFKNIMIVFKFFNRPAWDILFNQLSELKQMGRGMVINANANQVVPVTYPDMVNLLLQHMDRMNVVDVILLSMQLELCWRSDLAHVKLATSDEPQENTYYPKTGNFILRRTVKNDGIEVENWVVPAEYRQAFNDAIKDKEYVFVDNAKSATEEMRQEFLCTYIRNVTEATFGQNSRFGIRMIRQAVATHESQEMLTVSPADLPQYMRDWKEREFARGRGMNATIDYYVRSTEQAQAGSSNDMIEPPASSTFSDIDDVPIREAPASRKSPSKKKSKRYEPYATHVITLQPGELLCVLRENGTEIATLAG